VRDEFSQIPAGAGRV